LSWFVLHRYKKVKHYFDTPELEYRGNDLFYIDRMKGDRDRRQETGDRRQERGDRRRQETGR